MAVMKFKNVVLKNLFSKPVTKNYPAEPAVYPERSRGHVEINIDDCILCGICGMNCPARTIKVAVEHLCGCGGLLQRFAGEECAAGQADIGALLPVVPRQCHKR